MTRYMKGVPFSNKRYTKGVPFLKKIVYKTVSGWTSGGASPGVLVGNTEQTNKYWEQFLQIITRRLFTHLSKLVKRKHLDEC